MNRITFTPKRGLMTGLATMALALGAVFVAAPVAGAAADCSISRLPEPGRLGRHDRLPAVHVADRQ